MRKESFPLSSNTIVIDRSKMKKFIAGTMLTLLLAVSVKFGYNPSPEDVKTIHTAIEAVASLGFD